MEQKIHAETNQRQSTLENVRSFLIFR